MKEIDPHVSSLWVLNFNRLTRFSSSSSKLQTSCSWGWFNRQAERILSSCAGFCFQGRTKQVEQLFLFFLFLIFLVCYFEIDMIFHMIQNWKRSKVLINLSVGQQSRCGRRERAVDTAGDGDAGRNWEWHCSVYISICDIRWPAETRRMTQGAQIHCSETN